MKVKSSNIEEIHYDPESQILSVTFKNNKTYHYANVDAKKHQELMDFASHGSFGSHFAKHIKPYHKLLLSGPKDKK